MHVHTCTGSQLMCRYRMVVIAQPSHAAHELCVTSLSICVARVVAEVVAVAAGCNPYMHMHVRAHAAHTTLHRCGWHIGTSSLDTTGAGSSTNRCSMHSCTHACPISNATVTCVHADMCTCAHTYMSCRRNSSSSRTKMRCPSHICPQQQNQCLGPSIARTPSPIANHLSL